MFLAACPVCYHPLEDAIESVSKTDSGGSEFDGYPSLKQSNNFCNVKESMSVHWPVCKLFPKKLPLPRKPGISSHCLLIF